MIFYDFFLKNNNLGLKMKILKFLGIQPTYKEPKHKAVKLVNHPGYNHVTSLNDISLIKTNRDISAKPVFLPVAT